MKNHTIRLEYDPRDPAGPWLMSVGTTKYKKGKGNYDKIKIEKHDLGMLYFNIETSGIKFHPTNPIEIKAADPLIPGNPKQFVPKVLPSGVLKVESPNSDPVPTEYYYQLNFIGADPLDPIIQNGCCGHNLVAKSEMRLNVDPGAVAIPLLAFAIIVFVAARTRRLLSGAPAAREQA